MPLSLSIYYFHIVFLNSNSQQYPATPHTVTHLTGARHSPFLSLAIETVNFS